jgi:TRAP-type C4-dicarboxylate transport system permease small subunit
VEIPGRLEMKAIEKFWTIFDRTNNIFIVCSCAIIIAITVGISTNVILRYTLSKSFKGIIEVCEFGLLWMTFLGTAWLLRKDGHVRIDILTDRLNKKSKTIMNLIVNIFGVVMFALLVWFGTKVTMVDLLLNAKVMTVLEPPKWPIEMIIPIGCLLLLIESIRKLVNNIETLKSLNP